MHNNVPAQFFVPFTIVPFDKKDAKKNAERYIDTEFGITIEPSHSSMNNDQKKIDVLAASMLRIREDVISTAKSVFANEVKNVALV